MRIPHRLALGWCEHHAAMLCGQLCKPETQWLAVVIDDQIAAIALYTRYTGDDIEMAIAANTPRWASRSTIFGLLSYPFHQLGVWRVTSLVDITNRRAVKMNERLGFQLEGRLRGRTQRDDVLVFGLIKPDADRWLAKIIHLKRRDHGRQKFERAVSA